MVILGVVAGHAAHGKSLRDGAAAVIVDGRLACAVAEERLLRAKHAGGWDAAASAVLNDAGLDSQDVDVVAYSSCCDYQQEHPPDRAAIRSRFRSAQIVRVGHHRSHALMAYFSSPFERALVCVSDAGGNTLAPVPDGRWWDVPREQTSYWIADGDQLRLVDDDFREAGAAGFGEVFRAVTYLLGWHSSVYASKTMALAATGDPNGLSLSPPWTAIGDRLCSSVRAMPHDPIEMLRRHDRERLGRVVEARDPKDRFSSTQRDLAAWVQDGMEQVMTARLSRIIEATSVDAVCMAGGVAYNCHANTAVADALGLGHRNVFIPAAPGDTGQALGNAIAACLEVNEALDRSSLAELYAGPRWPPPGANDLSDLQVTPIPTDGPRHVVDLVAAGAVVAVHRGRSEFGARALGHRSLIADPGRESMRLRLNLRKGREDWMPFGLMVSSHCAPKCLQKARHSPSMQFVAQVAPEARQSLAAVTHVDGSTRAQTLDGRCEPWLEETLLLAEERLGVGALLNTSLNGPGEPIAERPSQTLDLLRRGVADAAVIDDLLVATRGTKERGGT